MKLTSIKELEIEDAEISVAFDLKHKKAEMFLSYTCPDCAGYGCRSHGNTSGGNPDCNGGSVSVDLDPAKIDLHLDKATASTLRSIVKSFFSPMIDK